jgi:general L-amino acid transport system permease protein
MATGTTTPHSEPPKVAFYNNPVIRGWIFQIAMLSIFIGLFWWMIDNAITNLEGQRKPTLKFFVDTAGFPIVQQPIEYNESMSYARAFTVGIVNTLIVAVLGIFFATFLGFFVGISRLSPNYVINKIAYWYVEIIRNLPLLFQLMFWYTVAINVLPHPRDSLNPVPGVLINQRGIFVPEFIWGNAMQWVLGAFLIGGVLSFFYTRKAKQKQALTGQTSPVFWVTLGLYAGLPLLVFLALGQPVTLVFPEMGGFNIRGGTRVVPEFTALLVGLVTYSAAFIGEIVRSGIQAVYHGQTEAGRSLGLKEGRILNLIVIPQALRVIIPPLTSQYLNITKNSSLAAVIGYPDMVYIGQTILNQSGQSLVIILLWMAVYLTISIITSLFMNWYNSKIALIER